MTYDRSLLNSFSTGQMHTYDNGGNDTFNLIFRNVNEYGFAHHIRAERKYFDGPLTNDTFNFVDLDEVNATVVGRLEDFDMSRDTIRIEGQVLDVSNPGAFGLYDVRIVAFNGTHNDPNSEPQPWLLIDTGGGHVFYALEGARVDMTGNGGANNGNQEWHFQHPNDAPANFAALLDYDLTESQNFVPAGYSGNGITYNEWDSAKPNVDVPINGTVNNDQIAGGLNDDTINSSNGNDRVWGGSGNDTINAGRGDDTVWGGSGNDSIIGNKGHDTIYGQNGSDTLNGWGGDDKMYGGDDDDFIYGQQGDDRMYGEAGHDVIRGSIGDDRIYGGGQGDQLYGGPDNDYIDGGNGWDYIYGEAGNDVLIGRGGRDKFVFSGNFGNDTINDYDSHNYEKIDLRGVSSITSFNDLVANHLDENAQGHAMIVTGSNSITLVGYTENGIANGSEGISASDFWF